MAEGINRRTIPGPNAQINVQKLRIELLETEFKKLCPSYGEEEIGETGSAAVHFALLILNKISPISSRRKTTDAQRHWQLLFYYNDEPNSPLRGRLIVHTSMISPVMYNQPIFEEDQLILTVDQATLLALKTYSRLVLPCYRSHGIIMMPFISRAFFHREDMITIAADIHGRAPTAEEVCRVILTVIQSCYKGGQYLEMSSAAVACIVAVKLATVHNLSGGYVVNAYMQYYRQNKHFSWDDFVTFGRYVIGGLPTDVNPQWLLKAEQEEERLYNERMR